MALLSFSDTGVAAKYLALRLRPKPAGFVHGVERLTSRIVDWVNACVTGTQDCEDIWLDAVYDPGETVAPPPGATKSAHGPT